MGPVFFWSPAISIYQEFVRSEKITILKGYGALLVAATVLLDGVNPKLWRSVCRDFDTNPKFKWSK